MIDISKCSIVGIYAHWLVYLYRKDEAIANARHIVMELEKHGEPAKSALAEAKKDLENLQNSQDVSSLEGSQKLSESMKLEGGEVV